MAPGLLWLRLYINPEVRVLEPRKPCGKRKAPERRDRFLSSLRRAYFLCSHKQISFPQFPLFYSLVPFTMARSFSKLNVFSALLVNALSRRGYASTTQGLTATAARGGAASVSGKVAKKSGEEIGTADKESWVPDPVTGYYRPENIKEIDVAELRATLLGRK